MEANATPLLLLLAQESVIDPIWRRMAERAEARLHRLPSMSAELATAAVCGAIVVVNPEQPWLGCPIAELVKRGIENIVAVGRGEHERAFWSSQPGVRSYYALPNDVQKLEQWSREAGERWRVTQSSETVFEVGRQKFSELIGESAEFRAALKTAANLIPQRNSTVFLTGEPGTGKQSVAKAIHYQGPRRNAPFVVLNCSSLPAAFVAPELFGYVAGAAAETTGAKPGLLEVAEGGTLFLEEVADLPGEVQLKLLRSMEDGVSQRVGGRQPVAIDVRIMASSGLDAQAAVKHGKFREDLYTRLNVMPIHLPPLRERGQDVMQLARHFLAALSAEFQVPEPAIGPVVENALMIYPWPGNVRELRNALERGLLLAEGQLKPVDLFPHPAVAAGTIPFPAPLSAIERAAAQAMLARYHGNKKAAAAALRISRSRLYRLLRDH